MKKEARIAVRVPIETRKEYERMASENGVTFTDVAAWALDEYMRAVKKQGGKIRRRFLHDDEAETNQSNLVTA